MVKLNSNIGELAVEFEYIPEDGVTFARLLKKTEGVEGSYELLAEGHAILADHDKWNKYVGRKYALARAFKALSFDRVERANLWEQFFNQCRIV